MPRPYRCFAGLAALLLLACGCGWRESLLRLAQPRKQGPPQNAGAKPPELNPHARSRSRANHQANQFFASLAASTTARSKTAPEPPAAESSLEQLLTVSVVETDDAGRPRDAQGLERYKTVIGWRLDEDGEPYRWTHAGLKRWNRLPSDRRPDLRPALHSNDPELAATAAIGLARSEGSRHLPLLLDIVHPFTLETESGPQRRAHDIVIRRAAIETMARLEDARVPEALDELYAAYAQTDPARPNPAYSAELHLELLRALARHASPASDKRFLASLDASSQQVRTLALRLMVADRSVPLSRPVVEQMMHGPPPMRLAAARALGQRRDPQYGPQLVAAAYDGDLTVRLAAIEALGQMGDADSLRALRELLEEGKTRVQEAAVLALGAAGDFDSVRRAAALEDWRVRRAAASALAGDSSDASATVVADLLAEEESADVLVYLVESLDRWPLERAGPLLLAAADSFHQPVRRAAFVSLARRWPPAVRVQKEFDRPVSSAIDPSRSAYAREEMSDRRHQLLAGLQQQWQSEFGAELRGDGQTVVTAAYASAHSGAGAGDDLAKLLPALHSDVPDERRLALEQLVRLARHGALEDDIWTELALIASRENDHANWFCLLSVVDAAKGHRPQADRAAAMASGASRNAAAEKAGGANAAANTLLYAALRQTAVEIPVAACRLLAGRGSPAHARHLLPLLDATSPAVIVAALEALAECGPLEVERLAAIERLLQGPNHLLRVEAALALSRLGAASGPAALERLTFDRDTDVRRAAVIAMGELRDPLFLDLLIAQLDERNDTSTRRAALAALPRVVGHDVARDNGSAPSSALRQEEQWRQWYLSGGRRTDL